MPAVISDVLLKALIATVWFAIKRFSSKDAVGKLLSASLALLDVDRPGEEKIKILRNFGLGLFGALSDIASAVLTIVIASIFSLIQAKGRKWVENQIGGSVDRDSVITEAREEIMGYLRKTVKN